MAYIATDILDKDFELATKVMALIRDKLIPTISYSAFLEKVWKVGPDWTISIDGETVHEISEIGEGFFEGRLDFLDSQSDVIKFGKSTVIKVFKIEQTIVL